MAEQDDTRELKSFDYLEALFSAQRKSHDYVDGLGKALIPVLAKEGDTRDASVRDIDPPATPLDHKLAELLSTQQQITQKICAMLSRISIPSSSGPSTYHEESD